MIFDLGGIFLRFGGVGDGGLSIMRGGRRMIGGRRGVEFIGIALRAGEREDLGADDGGWAMDLAEMRQRELKSQNAMYSI